MSNICLIVVENRKMSVSSMHYRQAIKILKTKQSAELKAQINKPETQSLENQNFIEDLDAGYLVLDFDSGMIIDCQSCFCLSEIKSRKIRELMRNARVLTGSCQTSQDTLEDSQK